MADTTDAWWAQQDNEQWHRHVLLAQEFAQEQVMKVSQMIESKFLRKEDFPDDQVCTIKRLSQENVGREDAPEQRWVLHFREYPKAMVLNVTTIRVLESVYGDESDNWIGKKVTVYVDPNVSFQGRVVGGLRLRPLKEKVPAGQSSQPQPKDEDFDDKEIPF